ncbi:Exo_endo_phos domain-containing protein [Cephalotus follicularis]|uniref:Exo_endo_phos domain-containing protein n=1 Tax=Cephalotus follicularis TaxID=3775 RepID=A0A1Q3B6E7_CEPFO|nr:Exo_endo_phos domain-containing protein [Cephalotus follicularis]
MFSILRKKVWHLCSRIRWLIRIRPKSKLVIRRLGKVNCKGNKRSTIPQNGHFDHSGSDHRPIRIATFNVAMFFLAHAIPKSKGSSMFSHEEDEHKSMRNDPKFANYSPKSILKQSPLHASLSDQEPFSKQEKPTRSKLKVSINLPDNEISLAQGKLFSFGEGEEQKGKMITSRNDRGNVSMRSPVCLPSHMTDFMSDMTWKSSRSILEVLREVDADILALQDVKAEEEKGMKPLSDLAAALGMKYVFGESWAPEYGNAILSKWPIKRWRIQKIATEDDFRNVLKATIDVPWAGEVNFYCTQLDHLDEYWRMKQITTIIKSNDSPHILAGGFNSLDGSDYSSERWADIIKYHADIGKPTPKVEVMKLLKRKEYYTDAKDFAGDCEPVVIIAKGQNVQGTCKYGTRVDYILASPDSPYKFVPGSYSVVSSKGTSDHHIVKVDIKKVIEDAEVMNATSGHQKLKQKVVKRTTSCSFRGLRNIRA